MLELSTIIANGVAAYRATTPDYAPPLADVVDDVEPTPNIRGVDEDRQRELCLSCPLPDCVGVDHRACPIRQEQLRIWREKKRH